MKLPDFSRLFGLQRDNDATGRQMAEIRGRFDALRTRHEDGTAPQAVSAYQLFQTPVALAARLVALIAPMPGTRILEPSAGLGRIIDALDAFEPSEIIAVENSPDCARFLFNERPQVTLKQRDFLALDPSEIEPVDFVAMNPPFHMRADIRHIMHALEFLKPGGSLAALCMDTAHRRKVLRPLCSHWELIPAGTFAESGTQTATVLLRIDAPQETAQP